MSRALLGVSLLCISAACRIPTDADGNVSDDDDEGFFGNNGNTQFGEEDDSGDAGGSGCVEVSTETLQLDNATAWGVTVAEVAAVMETPRSAEARDFQSGATTTLTVVGAATGTTASLTVREPAEGASDGSCDDWLQFDARMTFTDTAGWLDETIRAEVRATGPDDLSMSADITSLSGSLSLTDLIDEDETLEEAWISNSWRDDGISGEVGVQYRGEVGGGGDAGYVGAGRAISW